MTSLLDIPSDYWQLRELYMEKCLEHEELRKAADYASRYKHALIAAADFIGSVPEVTPEMYEKHQAYLAAIEQL